MKLNNLKDLLINQLEDLFDVESQLESGLPKMAEAATSNELKRLFDKRVEENGQQREQLQEVGNEFGVTLGTNDNKCMAMRGLVQEGQELLDAKPQCQVLDAGLILTAQKGAHYQIAAYGSARAYAAALGEESAENLLKEALDEQINIDKELSQLAIKTVNQDAVQPTA